MGENWMFSLPFFCKGAIFEIEKNKFTPFERSNKREPHEKLHSPKSKE